MIETDCFLQICLACVPSSVASQTTPGPGSSCHRLVCPCPCCCKQRAAEGLPSLSEKPICCCLLCVFLFLTILQLLHPSLQLMPSCDPSGQSLMLMVISPKMSGLLWFLCRGNLFCFGFYSHCLIFFLTPAYESDRKRAPIH